MVNCAWSKHTSNVLDFGFNHAQSCPGPLVWKQPWIQFGLMLAVIVIVIWKIGLRTDSRGLRWSLHQSHSMYLIFLHLLLTITNIVLNTYRSATKCRWKFHFWLRKKLNIHLEPGFNINPFLSLLSFLLLKSFRNSSRPSPGFQIIWILHQNEDLKINRFTQRKTSMSSGKLSSK